MAIFDVRSTHGGGKSFIMHELLRLYGNEDIVEDNQKIGHYCRGLDLAIVGRYDRVCGGCDGIKTQEEIERRLRLFLTRYHHVALEGILVAHTFSRYDRLARQLTSEGFSYNFLFLDTPLTNCIARVKARRLERGNTKELNPGNIIRDHERILHVLPGKFRASGHNVFMIHWLDSVNSAIQVIKSTT